jgi:hypothetical protein
MIETQAHLTRLGKLTTTPVPEEDEYTAANFGRVGSKPQLVLRIRKISGTTQGFVYAHLYTLDHEPSLGIILRFSQHRVVIQGRNLDDLYRYLSQFRVEMIQVIDPLHAEKFGEDVPVVTSVEIVAIRDIAPHGG